ncbi:hypothetical protein [Halosimplex halobium]|uniref:hypothetical protein n=1 Tax=Halosimplex halobium TaxID=3396618 RepID=UPI003F55A09F
MSQNESTNNQPDISSEDVEITAIDVHDAYGNDTNERVETIDEIPDDTDYIRVWYNTRYSVRYTRTDDGRTQCDYFDNDSYGPQIFAQPEVVDDDPVTTAKVEQEIIFSKLNHDGTTEEALLRVVGLAEGQTGEI